VRKILIGFRQLVKGRPKINDKFSIQGRTISMPASLRPLAEGWQEMSPQCHTTTPPPVVNF
jgi:hypothetical protein